MSFKISTTKPPVYDRCHKEFGVDWVRDRVIITYGDTVHCIDGSMSPDLRAHEEVHVKQQTEMGAAIWWENYFEDPKFRLDQELEAYAAQVAYIKKWCSKNSVIHKCDWILQSIVKFYGNMITLQEAKDLLHL